MNKKCFIRLINECEERLVVGTDFNSLCGVIFTSFKLNTIYGHCGPCYRLNWMFDKRPFDFWLGELDLDNLSMRKTVLHLFKEYCLSEKLYKEFKI